MAGVPHRGTSEGRAALEATWARCRQLVEGGYGEITPDEHGAFPEG